MAIIQLQLEVPKKLSDISLKEYQEYLKIYRQVEKDANSEKGVDKEQNDFLNLKALEIFCGLELNKSYKLPLNTFDAILESVYGCFKEETPLVQRFKMTGTDDVTVEFGFVPKLDEITLGEYIDLEKYISNWDDMHKAMAVLYRPIIAGKNGLYRIEDYEGTEKWADVMKDAPVNVALGATLFFYRLGIKLSKHTMNSILSEEMELTTHQREILEKNGAGINLYMDSLEVMCVDWMKSQSYQFTNV
jgi:hypothetical protein